MEKPNIIVIMTDEQKATASHLYGNPDCRTPSLERLAKEGVLFEHAFTPHPLCVPARCSLWTSQYPHQHGSRRNQTLLADGRTHAFRLWKEMGYTLGLIGKNHCFQSEADLALFDVWCEIGHNGPHETVPAKGMPWFRPLDGVRRAHAVRKEMCGPPVPDELLLHSVTDFPLEDYTTGLVGGQTIRFLETHTKDPFTLWVSFSDPHYPWELPRKYAEMFPKEKLTLPPWRKDEFSNAPEANKVLHRILGAENESSDRIYGVLGAYYGMIRFIDDKVGEILDTLDRLDLRRKTIVVFCSDHGDFMFEHGMVEKGGLLFDCLTRIPLIISWPGRIPSGIRENSPVNLIDIVPTLLALQGKKIPRTMQGKILSGIEGGVPQPYAFSEYGAGGPPFRMMDLEKRPTTNGRRALIETLLPREAEGRRKMVRNKRWKYIHDADGQAHELYDLENDPWEQTNVFSSPEYQSVISELRTALLEWSINTEDGIPVPLPGE